MGGELGGGGRGGGGGGGAIGELDNVSMRDLTKQRLREQIKFVETETTLKDFWRALSGPRGD